MPPKVFLLSAFVALLCTTCGNSPDHVVKSVSVDSSEKFAKAKPVGENFQYNLQKPSASWDLPAELLEISGNAWIDDKHLLAIEDLHPNLYVVRLDKEAVIEKTIPFAPTNLDKFDIEDVTFAGNTAYALWSHGTIYKIEDWQTAPRVSNWETGLNKANNTEGICYDPETKKLLIACKNNSGEEDEKKSTRAVYQLDPATGKMDGEPYLLLEKKELEKVAGDKVNFHPSGLAVHPLTRDIYILSTKDTKGLARYSQDGKLLGFQWIDKDLMLQPEGLCFSPDGTLYISTEGKRGVPAKIFRFDSAKAK